MHHLITLQTLLMDLPLKELIKTFRQIQKLFIIPKVIFDARLQLEETHLLTLLADSAPPPYLTFFCRVDTGCRNDIKFGDFS